MVGVFITPLLVKSLGASAYGYIGLTNDLVSYFALITCAWNALGGRYVSVALKKGNLGEARSYISTIFYANLLASLLITVAGIVVAFSSDRFLEIPEHLVGDVRTLIIVSFLSFIVSLFNGTFGISYFSLDRLYVNSFRTIESNVLRFFLLVWMLYSGAPSLTKIACINLISGLYVTIWALVFFCRNSPELSLSSAHFKGTAFKAVFSSGLWSLASRLSSLLSKGLDLLISNRFAGADPMGHLALARVPFNIGLSLIGSMGSSFGPRFTSDFATADAQSLQYHFTRSVRVLGAVSNSMATVLIGTGFIFFPVWLKTGFHQDVSILSIISTIEFAVAGPLEGAWALFMAADKQKTPAIVLLSSGALTACVLLACTITLDQTPTNVFIVALVGTSLNVLRNLVFTPWYSARCIKASLGSVYSPYIRNLLALAASSLATFFIAKSFFNTTVIGFVVSASIGVLVSAVASYTIVFTRNDREGVQGMVRSALFRTGLLKQ